MKFYLSVEQRDMIVNALLVRCEQFREAMKKLDARTKGPLYEAAEEGIQKHEHLAELFKVRETERE